MYVRGIYRKEMAIFVFFILLNVHMYTIVTRVYININYHPLILVSWSLVAKKAKNIFCIII